jgi:hypothetical protein
VSKTCSTIEGLQKSVSKIGGTIVAIIPDDIWDARNDDVIVLVKRDKPVWTDREYVVWHHNDSAGLYWGRYDLTLKRGMQMLLRYLDDQVEEN